MLGIVKRSKIMNTEYITLTDLDIDRLRTPKGAFNLLTLKNLKIPWLPGDRFPPTGWVTKLRGEKILRKDYDEAVAAAALPRLKGIRYGEAEGQKSLF